MKKFIILLAFIFIEHSIFSNERSLFSNNVIFAQSGDLYDPGCSTPLANNKLYLYKAGSSTKLDSVTTASDGKYTFRMKQSGSFVITRAATGDTVKQFDYPYVFVTHWGAKGDGVTDDRIAIQKAIDSLLLVDGSGVGTIYFPAGIFSIKDTLLWRAGVQLVGAGNKASIISLDSSIAKIVTTDNAQRGMVMENLQIRITKKVSRMLDLKRASWVRIKNIVFNTNSVSDTGLIVLRIFGNDGGGYWNVIEDCDFLMGAGVPRQVAIFLDSTANEQEIRGGHIANAEVGIKITGGNNIRIKNVGIESGGTGILLRDSLRNISDVLMDGNRLEGMDVGIRIRPINYATPGIYRPFIGMNYFSADTNVVDSLNQPVNFDWNTYYFFHSPGDQGAGGIRGVQTIDQVNARPINIGGTNASQINLGRTGKRVKVLDTLEVRNIFGSPTGDTRLILKGRSDAKDGIALTDSTQIGGVNGDGTLRLQNNSGRDFRFSIRGGDSRIGATDGAFVLAFDENNNSTTENIQFIHSGSTEVGKFSESGLTVNDTLFMGTLKIVKGSGSPENVVTAPMGSLFLRTDGGANTTLYVKESGTGNTGWIAK